MPVEPNSKAASLQPTAHLAVQPVDLREVPGSVSKSDRVESPNRSEIITIQSLLHHELGAHFDRLGPVFQAVRTQSAAHIAAPSPVIPDGKEHRDRVARQFIESLPDNVHVAVCRLRRPGEKR